jgi:hypothetical protein
VIPAPIQTVVAVKIADKENERLETRKQQEQGYADREPTQIKGKVQ